MKRIFTLCIALCTILSGFAQTDTTAKQTPDTIRIGNMVIIREPGTRYDSTKKRDKILVPTGGYLISVFPITLIIQIIL
jgi:hypothetical protein